MCQTLSVALCVLKLVSCPLGSLALKLTVLWCAIPSHKSEGHFCLSFCHCQHKLHLKSFTLIPVTAISSVYSSVHKPHKQTPLSLLSDITDHHWILPASLWAGLIISVIIIATYVYWKTKRQSRRIGAYYDSPMVRCNTQHSAAQYSKAYSIVQSNLEWCQSERSNPGQQSTEEALCYARTPTSPHARMRSPDQSNTKRPRAKTELPRAREILLSQEFHSLSLHIIRMRVLNSKNDTRRDDSGTLPPPNMDFKGPI